MTDLIKTTEPIVAALGSNVRLHLPFPDSPPLFIEPAPGADYKFEHFLDWARASRCELDRLILHYGGIVLRGFPLRTTDDFNALMECFPPYQRGYSGGWSPRRQLASRALESTVLERHLRLPVHSEMAYLRDYPPRIAFFCRIAASSGGETIIADLRRVTARLPEDVRRLVASHRIRYARNYAPSGSDIAAAANNPDKVPWDHAFGTLVRSEVDASCAAMDMSAIWNEDGSLTVVNEVDPFAVHPITGETIYRSTVHSGGRLAGSVADTTGQAFPTGSSFADGSRLSEAQTGAIKAVLDEATVGWPWQQGDLMILDNLLVAHGRNPYQGEREIQVSLLD